VAAVLPVVEVDLADLAAVHQVAVVQAAVGNETEGYLNSVFIIGKFLDNLLDNCLGLHLNYFKLLKNICIYIRRNLIDCIKNINNISAKVLLQEVT
jgi:hypothetical protein